jgi:hypothetical protein
MLTSTLTPTLRLASIRLTFYNPKFPISLRPFASIRNMASKSSPPKHEMAYFPNMTSSLPESSGEFRKVLWTGLYSQVVLMTIPVGGDIGDEVHTVDQALTFTSGIGKATINGKDQKSVLFS